MMATANATGRATVLAIFAYCSLLAPPVRIFPAVFAMAAFALFATPDGGPPVTVVDWQTAAVGVGPSDVAYFVGAGLLPDDRRRHERALVERYCREALILARNRESQEVLRELG